ncbi:MAG: hypothetical protein IT324_10040 [Anaerolineae bacterium]|nr:hypothetical protein [Anaerolineae bacterium]
MPGRHSTGSDLGGGGFGGSSGGGVDFGSGGSSWGGGGWRPSGPWNPGGFGGGFGLGGLLMGLLPFLFGARFGRGGSGGGCGCGGGLGCLILICVIVFCVASGGFGITRGNYTNFGGGYYGSGSGLNVNPVPVNPVSGVTSGLASEPPAVQTQTARDLRELHAAFDSKIPQWERQLTTTEYHVISGPEAGLTQDNNTREVIYGKCGSALYVFVVLNTRPDTGPADGEGYAYTTAASPGSCRPPTWTVYDTEDVGGNWYFVTLKSVADPNQGR